MNWFSFSTEFKNAQAGNRTKIFVLCWQPLPIMLSESTIGGHIDSGNLIDNNIYSTDSSTEYIER